MRPALQLLFRALLAGVLAAHVGGLLLLGLAIAVEGVGDSLPVLLATLEARLAVAWGQVAAVLGLLGTLAATARLRRRGEVLGLGTLGVSPSVIVLVGALCGAVGGTVAGSVGGEGGGDLPGAWERGDGGWIRDGYAWPDYAGSAVTRRAPRGRSALSDAVNAGAAGACGAALGLAGGVAGALLTAALLLVAEVVVTGLCARGAVPEIGEALPAALALVVLMLLELRRPIFPRRWA